VRRAGQDTDGATKRRLHPGRSRALLALTLGFAAPAAAQAPDLTLTPRWAIDRFQTGRAVLELELSRPLTDERLALLIGSLDVSALIDVRGTQVRYRPIAGRLPSGDSEVVAYRVGADGSWTEIGRAPLRVLTRSGLESGTLTPSVDLSSTGQLDQRVGDGDPPPVRRTYQDVTLNLGVQAQAARSGWQLSTQASALGVTQETQRLRWSDLQGDAPAIDLSAYRIQVARGRAALSFGSVTGGANRHLLSGFGSRGISAGIGVGRFATVEAALMNGTNVVGWTNLLGLAESAHRIGVGTLSLELMPSRPGALHLDVSGMDASVLPATSFNQGAVTDAEESRGLGIQVALSDAKQRIRFAGGISRSRFLNPADPLLAGDTGVVAVRPTARTARYGELSLQLLQGAAIAKSVPASLGLSLRHERVDPLYRSTGAYLQADAESNGVDLTGSVGPLSLQAALSGNRDNLGDIPSILTTRTRSRSLNAALPVGSLVGAGPDAWYWPSLSWSWQRVRQFGAGVPVNGDFAESHVPDQWSTSQSASLTWARTRWTLAYRWNQSFQDNRQPGREQADFRGIVHGLSLGLNLSGRLTTSLDVSVERQRSFETRTTQRLERAGGSLQWQITATTALSAALSQSWGLDPLGQQRTRNTEHQLELSQGFNLYRRLESGSQGRLFVRYARTRAATLPFEPVSLIAPRVFWTVNAGASLRLY
jgi:hypothetical protein